MSKEIIIKAAAIVSEQLGRFPETGISIDPDVADFAGSYHKDALTLDDTDLNTTGQGKLL